MLAKRWLILVAIFLLGMTTNSLSVWGQSVTQNTHFQGGNWLEKWLSGPLPGQPQQSTTSNQEAIVPPPAEVYDRSDITLHRKSHETAQRSSSPYQPQDIIGDREQQETPKRLSILEDMREPENIARGFYVGGGLGYTFFDTDADNLTGSAELDEESLSYKVFVGYKFNQFIAAELFYADLGEASLSGQTGDTFRNSDGITSTFPENGTIDASIKSFGISAIASYPMTHRISPFVKVGVHYWDLDQDFDGPSGNEVLTKTDDDGFGLLYGAGIDLLLSRHIAVRGEYEHFSGIDDSADVFSMSGLFKF